VSRLRGPTLFLLAFLVRLAYLYGFDDPLLSTEWNYLQGGLRIAEHESPARFVWTSDAWREWGEVWVVSPLYYVFLAAIFLGFGAQVRPVQVSQCGLDALTAVLVAAIGQRLEPRYGAWAGVVYALYWPSLGLPTALLSENLHTPLLVAGVALLLRDVERDEAAAGGGRRGCEAFLGGLALGLSALARSVSQLFIPIAAAWRFWYGRGRVAPGLLLVAGASTAILPWALRNTFVMGDPVPVETLAYYNLYRFNSFVAPDRLERRTGTIRRADTPAERRALALRYAAQGIFGNPGAFARKVALNVRHFLRPEGLHQLFGTEWPQGGFWHAGNVLLGDGVLLIGLPLFAFFLVAGPRGPERALLLLWTLYYVLLLVVVYVTEIRFRTALAPFVIAAAPAGALALGGAAGRRRKAGLLVAAALVLLMVVPQVPRVYRGTLAYFYGLRAQSALARGDRAAADALAQKAADAAPRAVAPRLRHARALAAAGLFDEAAAVYADAASRRADHFVAPLALPQVLRQAGRHEAAQAAQARANELVRNPEWNPTLVLAGCWLWLDPPVTDEVLVGRGDYGAVLNFHHDLGGHRWTRHTARVRLRPKTRAAAYDVVLEMGTPGPSPLTTARVFVRSSGGEQAAFVVGRKVEPHRMRIAAPEDGVLELAIAGPSWNRLGDPPDRGVRVDRVSLTPAP
jgi:hypothetical protein